MCLYGGVVCVCVCEVFIFVQRCVGKGDYCLSHTKLISSRDMDEIPGLIHKKGGQIQVKTRADTDFRGQIRILEGRYVFLWNYVKRDVMYAYFYKLKFTLIIFSNLYWIYLSCSLDLFLLPR